MIFIMRMNELMKFTSSVLLFHVRRLVVRRLRIEFRRRLRMHESAVVGGADRVQTVVLGFAFEGAAERRLGGVSVSLRRLLRLLLSLWRLLVAGLDVRSARSLRSGAGSHFTQRLHRVAQRAVPSCSNDNRQKENPMNETSC